jgi:dihydrofolate reductase
MGKIILYIAASIDGYIAKPDGDTSWLHDPAFITPGLDYGYTDFYKEIGTTLMGAETYRVIKGFNVPFPYPDKKNFVFTRSQSFENDRYVEFINAGIADFAGNLKKDSAQDIWLVGGAEINGLFLNHGLIDKIILTVIPVVLGKGIPIFKGNREEAKFKPAEVKKFDDKISQLVFELPTKTSAG